MTLISPVGSIASYIPPYQPFQNITPFTYRDGLTYLEVLEGLRCYVNETLVTFINDNLTELGDDFVTEVNALINTVNTSLGAQTDSNNAALTSLTNFVNTSIADDHTWTTEQIATMQAAVDSAVNEVINSSIVVEDPVAAGIINDPTSQTRAALNVLTIAGQGMTYVIPAGSTSDAAQAILSAAVSGSEVRFSPGTYAAPATGFTVANDNIIIDSRRATITSNVWGVPAFDLISRSNITLRLGVVQYIGARGVVGPVNFRGSNNYVGTTAVYINRDNCRVESLHAIGYVCGIYFAAWDGVTVSDRHSINNYVGPAVEIEQYNFGILWVGQNDLEVNGASFHDDLDDSVGTNPCHAIYGSSSTGFRDSGIILRNLRVKNNTHGQAYQAKYSDRLIVQNCRAYNCAGVFNCIDSDDIMVNGVISTGDLTLASNGSFSLQSTDSVSKRPNISNVKIVTVDNANVHAFQIISNDAVVNGVSCEVGYSGGAYSAGLSIFDVRGDRNRLTNISGRNRLNNICNGLVINLVNATAQGTIIENPVFKNVAYAIFIPTGVLDTEIQINDNLQNYLTAAVTATTGVTYSITSLAVSLNTLGENATLAYLAKDTPTHLAANTAVQVKVRPTRDITVNSLCWYSITPSGNYDIAIYDDASGARLWSKGSTPFPAAGLITEVLSGPAVILKAGRVYRITFNADNIVCAYRGITGPVAGVDKLITGTNNVTAVAAVFPLPDPLVAGASVVASFPLVSVLGTKAIVS